MIKFALCSSWFSVETSSLMDPHSVHNHVVVCWQYWLKWRSLISQPSPPKHPIWFVLSFGQGFFLIFFIPPNIPGVVVWLGGVEKGGRGEEESSVQLFNNWRNSRALENSLKKTRKIVYNFLSPTQMLKKPCQCHWLYPVLLFCLPASESLCGWMRVWTARSKSFLQKQRCSWAIGSAGRHG